MTSKLTRRICLFCTALLLAGCAGSIAHYQGKNQIAQGDVEGGLDKFKAAMAAEPSNGEYRMSYLVARETAVNRWLKQAAAAHAAGNDQEMERLLAKVLVQDPYNERVGALRERVRREVRNQERAAEAETALKAGDTVAAKVQLKSILSEDPGFEPALAISRTLSESANASSSPSPDLKRLRNTISIEFVDAPVRRVFEVFSRTAGVNFIFDKEVAPDLKTTVFLKNTSVEDAINLILLTTQLEKRVLDQSSILIFPNIPPKVRDYQPLTIKTFFLSNAEAKTVGNTIKTLIKTKDLVVDEQQNMVIMRDTLDAIRLAEKLVALHDLPQPEVMLDVAVIEVKRTNLTALGIQWPSSLTLSPLASTSGGSVTLADLKRLPTSQIKATLGDSVVNANTTDSDSNLLANPRIRTRNRETAKIMIGERLPNITTTATSTGFVSENIQYIDVGLKLEVQPIITPDNEISIKLSLEVSSVGSQTTTASGSTAYQIGTRNASTVLRLKDGENQILAGLINDEERKSGNKLPGLGELPVLGRLFGTQSDNSQKTEIVLSITPRLIRNTPLPTLLDSEFESGTELNYKVLSYGQQGKATAKTTASIPVPAPQLAAVPKADLPVVTDSKSRLLWKTPAQVQAGERFSTTLLMTPSAALSRIHYSLSYDPKALDVVSVLPGELLKQGGVDTSYSSRIDRDKGIINALEVRPGAPAPAGGALVTVTFQALDAVGSTPIGIADIKPTGSDSTPIAVELPAAQTINIVPK